MQFYIVFAFTVFFDVTEDGAEVSPFYSCSLLAICAFAIFPDPLLYRQLRHVLNVFELVPLTLKKN